MATDQLNLDDIIKELIPLLRDRELPTIPAHPVATGAVAPEVADIWFNTVRLTPSNGGIGSGCVVYRDPDPLTNTIILVTNAHVVDGCVECLYSWAEGFQKKRGVAKLLAIDYVHDLAILEVDDQSIPHEGKRALQIGESPQPGQIVTVCGFPLGCESPRVAQGMVSGYESLPMEGVEVTSVVIQAPINKGNSGGPVCDAEGNLVGIIWATNRHLNPKVAKPASVTARKVIEYLDQALVPISGYGFSLDPADLKDMLVAQNKANEVTRNIYECVPETEYISRADFVELQKQVVNIPKSARPNTSCIGIFNYAPNGTIHIGWWQGPAAESKQKKLDTPQRWNDICKQYFPQGGHFYLRGYDVVFYISKRKGYKTGFWKPLVRLQLS